MTENNRGLLGSGGGLVWRRQLILWWVFAVNFLLGGLGASGAARTLSDALSHSLAGQKLTNGFDVGMFLELVTQPDVQLMRHVGSSIIFAALFFLFMLFVTPGIIAVYLEDRRFTTGEFFGAAGRFFWPFVRLMLWSLIPFVFLNLLYQGVAALSSYVSDRSVSAQTSFWILVAGCIPVLLLFLWVRLWFDMAQARAVGMNDRAMYRNVLKTLVWSLERLWRVYWAYFVIGLLVWIITIALLVIWAHLPPTVLPATFVLLELIMLTHIFGRLWQKACATTWYVRNPEPVPAWAEPLGPALTLEPVETVATDIDAPLASEIEAAPEPTPVSDAAPPTKSE